MFRTFLYINRAYLKNRSLRYLFTERLKLQRWWLVVRQDLHWVWVGLCLELIQERLPLNAVLCRVCAFFVGVVPITITAGFIEGYITRHTEWPFFVRGLIIFLSLCFILFYYITYLTNAMYMTRDRKKIELYEERSFNENINTLFSFAKQNKRVLFKLFCYHCIDNGFHQYSYQFCYPKLL